MPGGDAAVRRCSRRYRSVWFDSVVATPYPGAGPEEVEQLVTKPVEEQVAVLAACRQFGGTEWVTLEQEQYPDGKSPMECTQLSLDGLKKIW